MQVIQQLVAMIMAEGNTSQLGNHLESDMPLLRLGKTPHHYQGKMSSKAIPLQNPRASVSAVVPAHLVKGTTSQWRHPHQRVLAE